MKIESAEYIKSFTNPDLIDLPELPSVAFIGRSNVGKSSLINHLVHRKKLVKTSSTPGKTQMINYFLINKQFYFVDLPGYGYAKVPENVRKQWLIMITSFLVKLSGLKRVVLIVDSRHPPTKDDLAFYNLLETNAIPTLVIANKVDKIKKSEQSKSRQRIINLMDLDQPPTFHSSLKKIGRNEIWKQLAEALSAVT